MVRFFGSRLFSPLTPDRYFPLITILLKIYNLLWLVAMVFLKRSPRVSQGWDQRTLQEAQKGPYDIWIQAASGGEAMLTNMVLEELSGTLPSTPATTQLKVLVTSGTKEGVESLENGVLGSHNQKRHTLHRFTIHVAYFPLDAPHLMAKAFSSFSPRMAVIVETELWPGFLVAAKRNKVPVLLINGRMSEKSFASYKHLQFFFKKFGPDKVLAISEQDGDRFSQVIGRDKVEIINNIKFDRIAAPDNGLCENPLKVIIPQEKPFILLGSVRKEEEPLILTTISELLRKRPEAIIGLFPKHIERADQWVELLESQGISTIKRSQTNGSNPQKQVIVWDVFGELAGAYALAKASFVGGSLTNLGGQNFLEPLVFGLRPVIGPYWKDFAWVGRGIVTSGLVTEVQDEKELTTALLESIEDDTSKEFFLTRVQQYFMLKKGGTHQTCKKIAEQLHKLDIQ